MKRFILCAAFWLMTAMAGMSAEQPRVLVYTKNQVGPKLFVHDNIPASVVALKKMGVEHHWDVEVSDDASSFTTANLQRFKVIVFDNSNNEILDTPEQKAALQRFVRAGGGIVGIHSASGSMRKWPWFWEMLGGKFARHAKMQTFTIKVKDPNNPSTAPFPPTFRWTDECYYLTNMPADLRVLLAGDLSTVQDPLKDKYRNLRYGEGDEVPLCWCHQFDGGREWYTALGHQKEHYADPIFERHLLGGILWAMGGTEVKH